MEQVRKDFKGIMNVPPMQVSSDVFYWQEWNKISEPIENDPQQVSLSEIEKYWKEADHRITLQGIWYYSVRMPLVIMPPIVCYKNE